jgi:hypothetical protein
MIRIKRGKTRWSCIRLKEEFDRTRSRAKVQCVGERRLVVEKEAGKYIMNLMNAFECGRREAVERGAGGAATANTDIMNRIMKIAHGLWHWARGVMASKIPSPASLIIGAGGGRLRFSEKRRQAAAVQDAGARHFVPVESTSAFAPKLPPSPGYGETSWRDTQVVDISSKMAEMRVVTRLISRRLGLKQAFFDPFLTLNHLGFSSLTEKLPDFFASGACTHYQSGDYD